MGRVESRNCMHTGSKPCRKTVKLAFLSYAPAPAINTGGGHTVPEVRAGARSLTAVGRSTEANRSSRATETVQPAARPRRHPTRATDVNSLIPDASASDTPLAAHAEIRQRGFAGTCPPRATTARFFQPALWPHQWPPEPAAASTRPRPLQPHPAIPLAQALRQA